MRASWSKFSTLAVGCVVMLAVGSGCSESHDPDPMNMKQDSGQPEQSGDLSGGGDAEDDGSTPEPSPEVEPVEVCGEIGTDAVQKALELPADAKVQDEDISPDASDEMAAGFSCRYSWGDDPVTEQVTVSVIPQTGKQDAEQAFADVIGENAKPYEDVGDIAGFDRKGRFGPETLAFVTVAETGRGLSSVTVLGHSDASEDGYAALAEELLDVLGS